MERKTEMKGRGERFLTYKEDLLLCAIEIQRIHRDHWLPFKVKQGEKSRKD